jgi:hypothetical protein
MKRTELLIEAVPGLARKVLSRLIGVFDAMNSVRGDLAPVAAAARVALPADMTAVDAHFLSRRFDFLTLLALRSEESPSTLASVLLELFVLTKQAAALPRRDPLGRSIVRKKFSSHTSAALKAVVKKFQDRLKAILLGLSRGPVDRGLHQRDPTELLGLSTLTSETLEAAQARVSAYIDGHESQIAKYLATYPILKALAESTSAIAIAIGRHE